MAPLLSPIDTHPSHQPAALRIGIIGTGPTALYTLKELLGSEAPCAITLFEAADLPGPGIPFSDRHNGPDALANIAGVELPPLVETLNQWASRQPRWRLEQWGIAGDAGDDRAFFPRVVLGAYFADQFRQMIARPGPHRITLRRRTRVTDVIARADGAVLRWTSRGENGEDVVDRLVIATGYQAPRRKNSLPMTTGTSDAHHIGILGSSLSAIDVVVGLAQRHGRFVRDGAGLRYEGALDWHATMLSRSGLLPEADFWFPCPAEPLDIFTLAALEPLVQGRDGDLDAAFALFARQLRALDPDYAQGLDLDSADADSFADRHFAARMAADPFAWARQDLAQARQSHRRRQTQPWRYAILRMHEAFGHIVPNLSPRDLDRFERGLKRCFIDNYAAVPHLSIRRLLALHDAGLLSVTRLGTDYRLTYEEAQERWQVRAPDQELCFDAMVDARGQQALGLQDFPFPTLRLQLCAQALARGEDGAQGLVPDQGYVVDAGDPALGRIHCLALPFLLKRNPFIQGLTESAAMAQATVTAILSKREDAAMNVQRMIADLDTTIPVYCGSGGVVMLPRPAMGA